MSTERISGLLTLPCMKWAMCQRTDLFTVIVDNRPHNKIQGQILEVATYENNLHEQHVQHPDSDHESEVVESSLTSTSSLVESESEEGHDRHNGSVFDNDEATVIDDETDQSTTASLMTKTTTVRMFTPLTAL